MSGGLTLCRQLRPSSRREHVRASNYSTFKLSNIQTIKKKQSNIQTTQKSLYSAAAFKKSKITSGSGSSLTSCHCLSLGLSGRASMTPIESTTQHGKKFLLVSI